ncbi:MAG: hypothetical protein ACOYO1_16585 [Bacteroidales bacterium]
MKTQKYIKEAELTYAMMDSLEKVKATAFFETRQLAYIDAKLQAKKEVLNRQTILKPAFIVFLIIINVGIVFSYLQRVKSYTNIRNSAMIELSDNYMRSNDYYLSIHK